MSFTEYLGYGLAAGAVLVVVLSSALGLLRSLPDLGRLFIVVIGILGWVSLMVVASNLSPAPTAGFAIGAFAGMPLGLALAVPVRKLLRTS